MKLMDNITKLPLRWKAGFEAQRLRGLEGGPESNQARGAGSSFATTDANLLC